MKFEAYAVGTVTSYFGEIEADTVEDAEDKAQGMLDEKYLSLCHGCNDEMELDDNWELKLEESTS